MKEIIGAVVLLVSLYGGTVALKNFNEVVKKAALEKASKGLPSLVEMNRTLRGAK
jgi:hypothetical protein